jgi:hypothetical protein
MLLSVVFCRKVTMLFGVCKVRVGHVRMVRGPKVIARFMMLRGFGMVVRGQPVVMGSLLVVFRSFL